MQTLAQLPVWGMPLHEILNYEERRAGERVLAPSVRDLRNYSSPGHDVTFCEGEDCCAAPQGKLWDAAG